jgi:hypothetical protein
MSAAIIMTINMAKAIAAAITAAAAIAAVTAVTNKKRGALHTAARPRIY